MASASRQTQEMYGVVSASTIIGEAVVNRKDESLGKIHELVIDAQEGRLAYAVLSFGGFIGMGNKLFAVPWTAFEFSNTENKLIFDVDKKKLEAAPGFDKDAQWPDFADRSWSDGIHEFYGTSPTGESRGSIRGAADPGATPGSAPDVIAPDRLPKESTPSA